MSSNIKTKHGRFDKDSDQLEDLDFGENHSFVHYEKAHAPEIENHWEHLGDFYTSYFNGPKEILRVTFIFPCSVFEL